MDIHLDIQMNIMLDIKNDIHLILSRSKRIPKRISVLISDLICSPSIRLDSCFAILICFLATGPASTADLAVVPQCSE